MSYQMDVTRVAMLLLGEIRKTYRDLGDSDRDEGLRVFDVEPLEWIRQISAMKPEQARNAINNLLLCSRSLYAIAMADVGGLASKEAV